MKKDLHTIQTSLRAVNVSIQLTEDASRWSGDKAYYSAKLERLYAEEKELLGQYEQLKK